MRVLIVDDEPLARTALENILRANPDVERFDSARDAIEAKEYLAKNIYEVMLLDISMPEISGLELLDHLQRQERPFPSVVFVTAYAQHAVSAFEKHAVDYILKPFSSQRVNQALQFASRRTENERLASFMQFAPQLQSFTRTQPSKIGIKSNGRILFIDPRAVIVVEAEGNYVLLRREAGSDLLRESISTVAEKLKPFGFLRVHRSLLVNASFVQEVRPCATGEYEVVVAGKEYTVTRTYKKNLKSLAHFWIGTGTFLSD